MTTVLFVWILSQGQLTLGATETFYTLEACQVAARAAENAPLIFSVRPDVEIRGICSTKRLPKDEKK